LSGPRNATRRWPTWQAGSAENPLFPLEVDRGPVGRTLGDLWAEGSKLHGDAGQPVEDAAELADILSIQPVGY